VQDYFGPVYRCFRAPHQPGEILEVGIHYDAKDAPKRLALNGERVTVNVKVIRQVHANTVRALLNRVSPTCPYPLDSGYWYEVHGD
jgi:hypothetical protein